jgi:hypothetical protein
MTDEDTQYLREIHAGMALMGLLVNGVYDPDRTPFLAYEIAEDMQKARTLLNDRGIASIKRRYADKGK